ncbi:MAG: PfaD family polyunsaturated fatty acid/polyketide biosynthesis protein [Pseudomonadota bacterium]
MSMMNSEIRPIESLSTRGSGPAYHWPAYDEALPLAHHDCRLPLALVRRRSDHAVGLVADPKADDLDGILSDASVDLLGLLPPIYPERLGDPTFRRTHGCRFAYVVGEMARGITTPRMVITAVRHGLLAFHGSAGLSLEVIEEHIEEIRAAVGDSPSWGANLIASIDNPAREMETVELFLRRQVRRVSASAFLKLTPAIVRMAASGLQRGADGKVQRRNFVLAKVSRPEVANAFLSPAPAAMLEDLVRTGHLSAAEAELAACIPVASDVTVEADSGGHTDNQALPAIFPVILRLRDEAARRLPRSEPVRIGAAGGIGTPAAVAAAFQLGAAYVVTGSINQSAVESGLSDAGKQMLAQAGVADVAMAPAADMFELGIKVQVLKRGSIFAARANKLYELYRRYGTIETLPAKELEWLEKQVLRMPVTQAWAETKAYHARRSPAKVARAEGDPGVRMAMIFRRYLFLCAQWARDGEAERTADFQIWCGPTMGAFNDWVRGSFLEKLESRRVAEIGMNLLEGGSVLQRAQQLRNFGIPVAPGTFEYRPRPLTHV